MIETTLSWFEVEMGVGVGLRRMMASLRDDRKPVYAAASAKFSPADSWFIHILGACGEMAFAKATNTYWDGSVNTFSRGDVGRVQVRTRQSHGADLFIRPKDSDTEVFVLVTGTPPTFRIVGWALGEWAKRPEWQHHNGGNGAAYFMPHAKLEPFR